MPELPEVETVVRGLRPRVSGHRIVRVRLGRVPSHGVVKQSPERFRRYLLGATITHVERRAKYILLHLRGKQPAASLVWMVHLGMSGQFYACNPGAERLKHTHVVAELSSGEQLRFTDPRRFGRTQVLREEELGEMFSGVGPDPLELSPDTFAGLLEGRSAPVKNLLLNQRTISGVGNIYANEALYLAKVHPRRPAGKLKPSERRALLRSLQRVLRAAIKSNGTTIADYRTSDGVPGGYQNRLRVYDREGEKCRRCGRRIKRLVLSQRSAHYCPGCQR